MTVRGATGQKMTVGELLRLPDDGLRHELVGGELRRMAPAGHHHGRLAMNIAASLDRHVREHALGTVYAAETGFVLARNPDTVRVPDVAFVRRERVEAVGDAEGYWPGAPDLAVEVVSPGDLYAEVNEKVLDWLDAGTRMVVIVDPRRRTVTVYRSRAEVTILAEENTLDGAGVIPDWRIPVRDLFA